MMRGMALSLVDEQAIKDVVALHPVTASAELGQREDLDLQWASHTNPNDLGAAGVLHLDGGYRLHSSLVVFIFIL